MSDDGRHIFAFGEKMLNLLDEGAFTSTYKFALLLALIDLCMERARGDGSAPKTLPTREIAEKIVELYWSQSSPFYHSEGETILLQNNRGQAEILSLIRRFRDTHAPEPSATLTRRARPLCQRG
jgi:transposase InsO family protein